MIQPPSVSDDEQHCRRSHHVVLETVATTATTNPLHIACQSGNFHMAKSLIEQGAADPDLLDHNGHAPIHLAILNRHLSICSLLFAIKAKLHPTTMSVFQLALEQQGEEFYEQMVLEFYGYELIDAIYDDNLSLVTSLTTQDLAQMTSQRFNTQRVDREIRFNLSQFKHCITLESLLHIAIKVEITSQIEMIKLLVDKGVLVSEKNVRQQTSLHLAVEKSNIECVRILIGALRKEFAQSTHANRYPSLSSWINSSDAFLDTNNETPLHYAARANNSLLCDLMLSSLGFELSAPNINLQYPHDLCTHSELKSKLLRRFKEQELMVVKSVKTQLLLEACKSGDLDVVKKILREHHDLVDCHDTVGRLSTPLHFASGYNRIDIAKFLIYEMKANVNSCDKSLLRPLHNSCSYGHLQMTALLVEAGSQVNAQDVYWFTPLHEATLKKRHDVCRLLISKGADVNLKNRDGQSPLDLAESSGDQDLIDIFRGEEAAFLDACQRGDMRRVSKLVAGGTISINYRDNSTDKGRNSTGLHLAAGYNQLKVVEFLLENGADATIRDAGGLTPLHNASSFGHVEVAALLVKSCPEILNLTDKWGYTALHEAAQKGRTQVCSLLIEQGIDVTIKNNQGQLALDLARSGCSSDIRVLLEDAMPKSKLNVTKINKIDQHNQVAQSHRLSITGSDDNNIVSNKPLSATTIDNTNYTSSVSVESGDGCIDLNSNDQTSSNQRSQVMTVQEFLRRIDESYVDLYSELFIKEQISVNILAQMNHEQLKEIGITAYGVRHNILQGIEKLFKESKDPFCAGTPVNETLLIELDPSDSEYNLVKDEMISSVREHRDGESVVMQTFEILRIEKIKNSKVFARYQNRLEEIREENGSHANERLLFHGSPYLGSIIEKGFDERHASVCGMFGAGIYFAENSSKSNQYVYGLGKGCLKHRSKQCPECHRQLLLCRVCLGKPYILFAGANRLAHAPPGHHSVCGKPSSGGLAYSEYVVYRGEQAYPEYLITYKSKPKSS